MKFKPYTYHICWTKLDIHYYGVRIARKHEHDLWNHYFSSSKYVKEFCKQVGEPDIVEIRKEFDTIEKAKLWETKVLCRLNVRTNDKWLNRYDRTYNGSTKPKSMETRQKMSISMTGYEKSTEHKRNLSIANKGKFCWCTNGTENKQIKLKHYDNFLIENPTWYKGKSVSDTTKRKQSRTRKLRIKEGKIIIKSKFAKGIIPWSTGLTKETDSRLKRMGEISTKTKKGIPNPKVSGDKNGMFGKTHSDEHKKAQSERTKKKKWYNNGEYNMYLTDGEIIPDGFIRGRITGWNTHPDKDVANSLEEIEQ